MASRSRSYWRDNGLTLALLALFLLSFIGLVVAGHAADTAERVQQGASPQGLATYLTSGQFLSAVFENWESEWLQMASYVMLTAYLFQRGSPESKDPDGAAPQDRDPALDAHDPSAPWPVRSNRLIRALYAHSLGIAMLALFLGSFILHGWSSARHAAEDEVLAGLPSGSIWSHLGEAQFWFESFQNWQSEFFSTAVLILLAIYLRERGSPESKPVAASHQSMGGD